MSWFHHNAMIDYYKMWEFDDERLWKAFKANINAILNRIFRKLAQYDKTTSINADSEILLMMDDLAKNLDGYFVVKEVGDRWLSLISHASKNHLFDVNPYIFRFDGLETHNSLKEKARLFREALIDIDALSFEKGIDPEWSERLLKHIAMIVDAFFISIGLKEDWLKLVFRETE